MPVEFAAYVVSKTTWLQYIFAVRSIPYVVTVLLLVFAYRFFQGTRNPHDVDMHGRVILMTGGTSGIGASVADALAVKGAQLILLVRNTSDGWTQEYVTSMRERTGNDLIYAEQCDLEDLHSVRKFATRWIDNTPPRRLDQVILCAGVTQPMYSPRRTTRDGIEIHLGVNYLAHDLLLTILSPSLRAQPSERDVRVIVATCTTYILGHVDLSDPEFLRRGYPTTRPWQAFGASKLLLMTFTQHLQRKIDDFKRPDGLPSRVKCLLVDPGFARTVSFRRFVSFGTLTGLCLYLLTYPIWFLLFKTASGAAQTILYASMAPSADVNGEGVRGGDVIQECSTKLIRRPEIQDEAFQSALWQMSENLIKEIEKRSALARKQEETTKKKQESALPKK